MDIKIKEMAEDMEKLLKDLEIHRTSSDLLNHKKLDELYQIYYRMQEYLEDKHI